MHKQALLFLGSKGQLGKIYRLARFEGGLCAARKRISISRAATEEGREMAIQSALRLAGRRVDENCVLTVWSPPPPRGIPEEEFVQESKFVVGIHSVSWNSITDDEQTIEEAAKLLRERLAEHLRCERAAKRSRRIRT